MAKSLKYFVYFWTPSVGKRETESPWKTLGMGRVDLCSGLELEIIETVGKLTIVMILFVWTIVQFMFPVQWENIILLNFMERPTEEKTDLLLSIISFLWCSCCTVWFPCERSQLNSVLKKSIYCFVQIRTMLLWIWGT